MAFFLRAARIDCVKWKSRFVFGWESWEKGSALPAVRLNQQTSSPLRDNNTSLNSHGKHMENCAYSYWLTCVHFSSYSISEQYIWLPANVPAVLEICDEYVHQEVWSPLQHLQRANVQKDLGHFSLLLGTVSQRRINKKIYSNPITMMMKVTARIICELL